MSLGKSVLRAACDKTKAWQRQGLTALHLAVNVSMRQLDCHAFVPLVEPAPDGIADEGRYLGLELTQTATPRRHEYLQTPWRSCRRCGCNSRWTTSVKDICSCRR